MALDLNQQKKFDEIIDSIRDGNSVRSSCAPEWRISQVTFFDWLRKHVELQPIYAQACEERHISMFENLQDKTLADMRCGRLTAQEARVEADVVKWQLGKMRPDKYGDNTRHTVSGPDGGPVQITVTDILAQIEAAERGLPVIDVDAIDVDQGLLPSPLADAPEK